MSAFSGSSTRALRYAASAPARSKPSPKRRPTASCCSIQPSVFHASADLGSSFVAASASRCARVPSPASSSAVAARSRCTALRGYFATSCVVGVQRALEVAVGAQRDADLVERDELRLGVLELAQRREQRVGFRRRVAALHGVEAPGGVHGAVGGDLEFGLELRRTQGQHIVRPAACAPGSPAGGLDAVAPLGDEGLEHHVGCARRRDFVAGLFLEALVEIRRQPRGDVGHLHADGRGMQVGESHRRVLHLEAHRIGLREIRARAVLVVHQRLGAIGAAHVAGQIVEPLLVVGARVPAAEFAFDGAVRLGGFDHARRAVFGEEEHRASPSGGCRPSASRACASAPFHRRGSPAPAGRCPAAGSVPTRVYSAVASIHRSCVARHVDDGVIEHAEARAGRARCPGRRPRRAARDTRRCPRRAAPRPAAWTCPCSRRTGGAASRRDIRGSAAHRRTPRRCSAPRDAGVPPPSRCIRASGCCASGALSPAISGLASSLRMRASVMSR